MSESKRERVGTSEKEREQVESKCTWKIHSVNFTLKIRQNWERKLINSIYGVGVNIVLQAAAPVAGAIRQ